MHVGRLAAAVAGLFLHKGQRIEEAKEKPGNGGFSLPSEATAEGRQGRMAGLPAIVRQRLVAANHHAHYQSMNAARDPRACRESEIS